MAIFNRNDQQVIKDANSLPLEIFLEMYKSQTSDTVLKSVHKSHDKTRVINEQLKEQTDAAVDLPPVEEEDEIEADDDLLELEEKPLVIKEAKEKKKKENNDKFTNAARGRNEDGTSDEVDKPGRTPRMRELMVAAGKKIDKAVIKQTLTDEGFNTKKSSFHGEWSRVFKELNK